MSATVSRKPDEAADAIPADAISAAPPRGAAAPRVLRRLRRFGRAVASRASSSLTRRIVVLNLAGLVALLVGFLTLNQFRQGLIEARVASLLIQGEIIAGAIAASATVETGALTMDPDRLLELQAGESPGPPEDALSPLEFSINPERVAPVLSRLVTPTGTRARIYDADGSLILDSRTFTSRGDGARGEVTRNARPSPSLMERAWRAAVSAFRRERASADEVGPADARTLPDVVTAVAGRSAPLVRVNRRGETIVSVAVPIRRGRAVQGALLLSTQGGDIDATIASERFALLEIFLVACLVMMLLSLLLAGAIAGPVRRLADAAERVRRGTKGRQVIPDFTGRSDEIGHLSGALRDMTDALYNRIDAIQSFAADVAHELKNPLTSLRSAVETLPVARTDQNRERLLSIMAHDVRRLDRLISDISDASRLDAELARGDAEPIDMRRLVETVAAIANDRRRPHERDVTVEVTSPAGADFRILGHDGRLGQVFSNLIDNARSFSPPGGRITIWLERSRGAVVVTVDDEGPGIPAHAVERVFERFYTDRPDHGFGQNSGLGLSISRQIVEAHRGTIRAVPNAGREADGQEADGREADSREADGLEPDDGPAGDGPAGARFVVRIPALAA